MTVYDGDAIRRMLVRDKIVTADLTASGTITAANMTVTGTFTFGDAAVDTLILKGRVATMTAGGSNVLIDATYINTYQELWENRCQVTAWGSQSSFKGFYFRTEAGVDSASKGLRTMEVYAMANAGFSVNDIKAAYFEAGMKASGAQTIPYAAAAEFALAPYTGTGAITITNYWDCVLLTPSGVSSRIDGTNAAKINGIHLMARDGDGASTKLGDGIKMENDSSQSGTRTLTNGINLAIDTTTGLNISGASTTAISLSGDATTGISITSGMSATNAISIAASASTAGINISGNCTTGVTIGAQTTAGLAITGATATGIVITGSATDAIKILTGTYTTALNIAGTTGTGVAIGASTTGISLTGARTTGISMAGALAYTPIAIGTKANTSGSGLILAGDTDNSGGVQIYADDGGVALTADVAAGLRSRTLVTASHSSGKSIFGTFSQLVTASSLTLTTGNYGAAYIFNQVGADMTLVTSAQNMALNLATTVGAGTYTVGSGCIFAGLDVNIRGTGVTITNNGTCAGVLIRKLETITWPVGLKIGTSAATTAIEIGSCTTGISVSGTGAAATSKAMTTSGWTINNANLTDGIGTVEADLTLTGTVAGHVAASSAWVNMASVTTGSNYICAQSNGLWSDTGGILTNGVFIFGMRAQCLLQTNGGVGGATFYPFSVINNTNVTTAIFKCNDATSDLGETSISEGAASYVPLFSDNEGLRYVKVYKAT